MILFAHTITPRLEYITRFISQELFTEPVRLTADETTFRQASGPKINYSNQRLCEEEFYLAPQGLLSESGIREQDITCFEYNGFTAFFRTAGDIPFDIFSAAFYLLSRYEEYLPHSEDMYGRYAYENSLAFRAGFLQTPLVNTWLNYFKDRLQPGSGILPLRKREFRFIPTYDIDEAFCYRHKSARRTFGASLKDLFSGRFGRIAERLSVLNGRKKDPFNSFDFTDELHREGRVKPVYFFLVAARNGQYDKQNLPALPAIQHLIQELAGKYETGLHPSWQSGDDHMLLAEEKQRLERITGKKIQASRQHFIRLNLPGTYRLLAAAGIQHEYSMGYGSINGFRASVASPFSWYDLEKETDTGLQVHPFCYMEANSYYEQGYSPAQALEEMRSYYREVYNVQGTMISIWHNTFLGTAGQFAGWREAYAAFYRETAGK